MAQRPTEVGLALYASLVKRWSDYGVLPAAPCPREEVERFKAKYSVVLPDAVHGYLSTTNGMVENAGFDQDKEGFSFWPLSRWSRLEDASAESTAATSADDRCLFVFADYLSWSWAYALDLGLEGSRYGSVCLVGDGSPYAIASTFVEFVESYLEETLLAKKR